MDINAQKEQFSVAYVRAVASVSGFSCTKPDVDDASIDIEFRKKGEPTVIAAQLKASSSPNIKEDHLNYPLPIKNYNDLRAQSLEKRILIILIVPGNIPTEWIEQSSEQLLLKKCAYWVSLENYPDSSNEESVTIKIPLSQRFTVDTLDQLMCEHKKRWQIC